MMFEEWGFLLTEIWVLLVLAALVGLLAGYFLFGPAKSHAAKRGGADKTNRLRSEVDQLRSELAQRQARVSELEDQIKAAGPMPATAKDDVDPTPEPPKEKKPSPATAPLPEGGAVPSNGPTKKPMTLDAPRKGQADDLKRIKGVGPRMEQMCNMLGFWHYEQVASWTDEEVAWVDQNLQGFQGRVSRDDWVGQATVLAKGWETEFSARQDTENDEKE